MRLAIRHDWRANPARLGVLGLLALAGSVVAGCGGSFDPYNRLNSLRVLAIRSGAHPGEAVAPAMGETTTIDAKIYTLPDHPGVTYNWSWCPFATAAGAACPVTEDQASMLAGIPVSFTLPAADDGSTTFTNPFSPDLLQMLCAGMGNIPAPDCTNGFPIQLQLIASTDNDSVQAVRPLYLIFDSGQKNQNPTVTGLSAAVGGGAGQRFDGDPPATMPTLPRNVKTAINTTIDAGDSETYMGKDDNNSPAVVSERLNLSWFVESGNTDHQRTAYIAGQVAIEDAATVKWTPAFKKDYAPDTSKLILIIRDDRQGVGWIDGTVSLEPTP